MELELASLYPSRLRKNTWESFLQLDVSDHLWFGDTMGIDYVLAVIIPRVIDNGSYIKYKKTITYW